MTGGDFSAERKFTCLEIRVEHAIGYLHLNRPDLLNRFDEPLHAEFPAALAELSGLSENDIFAVIISAEGAAFSAGGDLEMMVRANQSAEMRDRLAEEGRAIIRCLVDMAVPVVAAVQGPAIGLGATIISCCDIVVAWKDAKIADPHVALGLVAGDGGVLGWSQSVGVMRAKRYLLTGDRLTAEQAFAFGLVTDLVDNPEDALPVAVTLARQIAAMPNGGVRGTKRAFGNLTRELYFSIFERSLADEMQALGSEEFKQSILAMR